MVCFYHPDKPGVGTCRHCHRSICSECMTLVNDTLACKNRHEEYVRNLILMEEKNILQAKRMGSGYIRNGIFYTLVGLAFSGFGLLQFRFLGVQSVFFMLIGLFLLYAAAANFGEGRKYK